MDFLLYIRSNFMHKYRKEHRQGKKKRVKLYTFPSKNENLNTASSCHQYIFRDPNSLFFRVISRAVSLMAYILAARLQFGLPGQKRRIIYKECVVPENIQTPTTEGISLRTPHPPPHHHHGLSHFCRELMTPYPSGISTRVTKTPQPLWTVHFNKERLLK